MQPEIWLYVQGFDEKIADVLGSRKLMQEKQKQDYQFKSEEFLGCMFLFIAHCYSIKEDQTLNESSPVLPSCLFRDS